MCTASPKLPREIVRRQLVTSFSQARSRAAAPLVLALVAALGAPAGPAAAREARLRVATFNLSLYGREPGEIRRRLQTGDDPQARRLAEIIQRVRPDVLLINEFDYDPQGEILNLFCDNYLAISQNASGKPDHLPQPVHFPHRYVAPSNTGVHSGFDLDRNGSADPAPGNRDHGSDSWGFGVYEGQYAFAILSRFPIDEAAIRTFQKFRWRDMPGALLPDDPDTPAPADWYSAEILEKFPLSSKNHVDVPVIVDGRRLHLLASHPTPPVFDGPEDRNGRRNHDELRFWRDYIASPRDSSGPLSSAEREGERGEQPTSAPPNSYIVDDRGRRGGLSELARSQESGVKRQESGASGQPPLPSDIRHSSFPPPPSRLAPRASRLPSFLLLGDLNGDPHDGDGSAGIASLLAAPELLQHDFPASAGAVEAARLQGAANQRHRGDPRFDTVDARDEPAPGNLHIDYVLPSADLQVVASGVFWPEASDPLHPLVTATDHRLVWVDVSW